VENKWTNTFKRNAYNAYSIVLKGDSKDETIDNFYEYSKYYKKYNTSSVERQCINAGESKYKIEYYNDEYTLTDTSCKNTNTTGGKSRKSKKSHKKSKKSHKTKKSYKAKSKKNKTHKK
jgi:hypothetical protein